jgi:phosphomannomutase
LSGRTAVAARSRRFAARGDQGLAATEGRWYPPTMGIFKSYDIRAVYGAEWDRGTAYRIGCRLPGLLGARNMAVGRDARLSSPEILEAFEAGALDSGCDVTDLGECTTPAVYFATAFYGFDGSVMITASHNPPEYNGMKVSRAGAVPVGYDSGLAELERLIARETPPAARRGVLATRDLRADYLRHVARFADGIRGIRAVADCSDGMAGLEIHDVARETGASVIAMNDRPDGRFPHHPPNPLEERNLDGLRERVIAERADLGVCFDGDADRAVFVDETATIVSPDLITPLLARYFFRHAATRAAAGTAVLYDVRSSRAVPEDIAALGGAPVMCKVGHSHAKKLLRETGGVLGGEYAGHYYFRDNYFCDSGMIAMLVILSLLGHERVPLSRLVPRRYHSSGEINFRVEDREGTVRALRDAFPDGRLTDMDGVRVDYPTWWFNVRASNTEPYLRLIAEAATRAELDARVADLTARIRELS